MSYGLTQVVCQDCGSDGPLVNEREIRKGIETGEYVKGSRLVKRIDPKNNEPFTTTENGVVFFICKDCRRKAEKPDGSHPEDMRHRRIMERLRHVRRNNPGMSLEEAATRATEDEFEPESEPNREFRRYLIERQERGRYSKEQDRIAKQVIERLDGPQAESA